MRHISDVLAIYGGKRFLVASANNTDDVNWKQVEYILHDSLLKLGLCVFISTEILTEFGYFEIISTVFEETK